MIVPNGYTDVEQPSSVSSERVFVLAHLGNGAGGNELLADKILHRLRHFSSTALMLGFITVREQCVREETAAMQKGTLPNKDRQGSVW